MGKRNSGVGMNKVELVHMKFTCNNILKFMENNNEELFDGGYQAAGK